MTKKMSCRDFIKLSGTVAGATVLAACAPPATPAIVKETVQVLIKETVVVTTAPKPAGTPIKLTFWTFVNDHADFRNAHADAWNTGNPDRPIRLKPLTLPYENMHNKLLLSLQADTGAPLIRV